MLYVLSNDKFMPIFIKMTDIVQCYVTTIQYMLPFDRIRRVQHIQHVYCTHHIRYVDRVCHVRCVCHVPYKGLLCQFCTVLETIICIATVIQIEL